jgi:hypothetical protein
MNQPSGRHRRPSRTLAERVWSVAATLLAAALTYVFVPPADRGVTALGPAPDRLRILAAPEPEPRPTTVPRARRHVADEDAGPLVRPYLPPYPAPLPPPPPPSRPGPPNRPPLIPRPRIPEGDLLAAPREESPDDLGELTAAVRAWLDMARGANRP